MSAHGSRSIRMSESLRVVVAEDNALLREGLVTLITRAGFDVVAQAASYEELLAVASAKTPDVILTDIKMPPSHTDEGLRAAQSIRSRAPRTAVLVLSQYAEPEYAERLLGDHPRGVGYLLKDRVGNAAELTDAVRRVAAGETVVDPEVIGVLMARRRDDDLLGRLSGREAEILRLMAEGRSNIGISRTLYLSPKTVERHVAAIFLKLDLEPGVDENRRVLAVLRHLRN